jgi:CheY-like chemotaxis protein
MAARVLICEPSDDVRELLAAAIRRLGYEAVAYEDSGRHGDFDVVVLEPASERHLNALTALASLPPVVALSIYAPEEQPNGIAIAAHLAKPFSLGQLGDALAAALRPPE